MRKLKALKILNGYQANVFIVLGKQMECPDEVPRIVKQIEDISSGKYLIVCEGNVKLIVRATDVIEQI
jgi:hypothetical protein